MWEQGALTPFGRKRLLNSQQLIAELNENGMPANQ